MDSGPHLFTYNLTPPVNDEEEVTLAIIEESYQKVLNSPVQLEITTSDGQSEIIPAVDQDGTKIKVRDLIRQ